VSKLAFSELRVSLLLPKLAERVSFLLFPFNICPKSHDKMQKEEVSVKSAYLSSAIPE